MSPRAARRLEGLGFERVYDYVPGKADWFVSGLPRESNPATFWPNEPVEKMLKGMQARGSSAVLVTTSDGRLVGLLYRKDAEHPAGVRL
jgi:CBS domain-containing protein